MSKKLTKEQKEVLREDLIDRLMDKFFDSVSKSNQDRFLKTAEKQNPTLAKAFDDYIDTIDNAAKKLRANLKKINYKPNPNSEFHF
jgi:hypothetical protein